MKKLYLIFAICMTNFLYPCEWMFDIIGKNHEEALFYLNKFDNEQFGKPTVSDAYWYTLGRKEAFCDLLEELEEPCECPDNEE